MLIGIHYIGECVFDNTLPFSDTQNSVKLQNCIADTLHIDKIAKVNDPIKWTGHTRLLARFNGNFEAGNVDPNELNITKWRIKRNKPNELKQTVGEVENQWNVEHQFEDYFVKAKQVYEYTVVPLIDDVIEGDDITHPVEVDFDGWWLIDEDTRLQFLYNLDDAKYGLEEDREEIRTFSKYPLIRYGPSRFRRGTLMGLFIPQEKTAKEMEEMLDSMIEARKPYILKDGQGRYMKVNIYEPEITIPHRTLKSHVLRVGVRWVEIADADS